MELQAVARCEGEGEPGVEVKIVGLGPRNLQAELIMFYWAGCVCHFYVGRQD